MIELGFFIAFALTAANIALEIRDRKNKKAGYISRGDIFRRNLK